MSKILKQIQDVLIPFHELILIIVLLVLLVCTYTTFEAVRLNRLILIKYEQYMKGQVRDIHEDIEILKGKIDGR